MPQDRTPQPDGKLAGSLMTASPAKCAAQGFAGCKRGDTLHVTTVTPGKQWRVRNTRTGVDRFSWTLPASCNAVIDWNVGARLDPRSATAEMQPAASSFSCNVNIYTRPDIDDWWPGGELVSPFFSLVVPVFFCSAAGYRAGPPLPGDRFWGRASRSWLGRCADLSCRSCSECCRRRQLDVWRGGDWRVDSPDDIVTGDWQLTVFVAMQFQLRRLVASRRVEASS